MYPKIIKKVSLFIAIAVIIISGTAVYMFSQSESPIAVGSYSQLDADDILVQGVDGTCTWTLEKNGTLTLWNGTPAYTTPVSDYYVGHSTTEQLGDDWNAVVEQTGMVWWHYGNDRTPWSKYRKQVKKVIVKDEVELVSAEALFYGLDNMTEFKLPADMSKVTTALGMFDGCTSLVSADLHGVNMPQCTTLRYAFRNCLSLRWVYLNDLDTKNVNSMRFMFQNCNKMVNVDLSNFDTSNINDMTGIFYYCSSLESVDLRNFNLPIGAMSCSDAKGVTFTMTPNIKRLSLGTNTLSHEINYAGFATQPPSAYPYTGKWVNEDNPNIVLTTSELVANYPNTKAPVGTYVWQVVNDIAQVSFDANGGESARESITQKTTATPIQLTEKDAVRNGYKLLGWNTERDGSGTSYPASCSYTPTIGKNVILYAQWASYDTLAPLNYIIEGYDNLDRGGIYEDATANDYQGYHPIGNVVELTDIVPKRTAHKFLGWSTMPMEDFAYLDDDGAQAFLESDTHVNNAIIPSDGITVYAVWQQDYPTKIINGGFEVVDKSLFSKTPNSVGQFGNNFEVRKDGSVRETWQVNGSCDEPLVRKQLPVHITHKTFGWLQETGPGINITAYNDLSNMYSTVNQSGAVDGNIYQDILTIPGNIYKWRIRHTSRAAGYVNHLNILIGKQKDTLYPQDAYRTSQNVWKQSPLGFVGTDIATISNHTPNDLKNLDKTVVLRRKPKCFSLWDSRSI